MKPAFEEQQPINEFKSVENRGDITFDQLKFESVIGILFDIQTIFLFYKARDLMQQSNCIEIYRLNRSTLLKYMRNRN